jgi:hypothetical protein
MTAINRLCIRLASTWAVAALLGCSDDSSSTTHTGDAAVARDASAADSGAVAVASDCTSLQTHYAQVVCAANNFLATLTAAETTSVVYEFSNSAAKTVWSNLPGVTRNGIKFSALSAESLASALAVAKVALATQGYDHLIGVLAGDDYLNSLQSSGTSSGMSSANDAGTAGAMVGGTPGGGQGGPAAGGGGGGYGSGNYSIAFIGKPSTTSDWMLQIGGHHMAYNITYRTGVGYPVPHHLGVEPKASFTVAGDYAGTYQPLNDRGTSMFAIFDAFSTDQMSSAYLSGQTFADVLLGPVEYGTGSEAKVVYPTQTGVLVSSLSTEEQAAVTTAIGTYVNDYDSSIADPLMQTYTSSDAYAKTHLAYGAPDEGTIDPNVNTTYLRIDGPRLWLELSCQAGVVIQGISHFHTIYRDKTEDYGASL